MTEPTFWDDHDAAQEVIDESNWLKEKVEQFEAMDVKYNDEEVMYELIKKENYHERHTELLEEVKLLQQMVKDFQLEMILSEPSDKNNAIIELHTGAGGTESQDWASILLRMSHR